METQKPMTVETRFCKARIDRGAVVHIEVSEYELKIRNLSDTRAKSVILSRELEDPVILFTGQERIFYLGTANEPAHLSDDGISRRKTSIKEFGRLKVLTSEVSFVSLCEANGLLCALRYSNRTEEKRLFARLLRTAACLQLVTTTHGPFSKVCQN